MLILRPRDLLDFIDSHKGKQIKYSVLRPVAVLFWDPEASIYTKSNFDDWWF